MEFEKLGLKHKQIFENFLKSKWEFNCNYYSSENVFENLFIWSNENVKISVDCFAIYVLVLYNEEEFFLPPICENEQNFIQAFANMHVCASERGRKLIIKSLSSDMLNIIKNSDIQIEYTVVWDEPNGEYIYDTQDLVTYQGRKFNKKRNFLNKFIKSYSYEIVNYEDKHRDDVMQLYYQWSDNIDIQTNEELTAFKKALDNKDAVGLKGTLVFVEGKLVACAFGVISFCNLGIELFEKADISYDGAYSVICHEFSRMHFANCRYINRQEDMGLEGLKKSKLSYNPVFVTKEYVLKES